MLDPASPSRNLAAAATPPAKRAGAAPAQSDALPDLLLIERARNGDERAIGALMRRYARRLFRVAWSVLMDAERTEAAVLEACLAAFGDLGRYELSGKFAAWLTRLAYNQARALREPGRARDAAAPAQPAAGESAAAVSDAARRERQELEHAIAGLPEAFRTVYVLRVLEGISGIEAAASLGLHTTTVRTRLYRAHRRLDAGVNQRLQAAAGLLEPAPACIENMVARACARLLHGSMLSSSASAP
jgi:RNA polymerase sigma-70 factor, ECF subfamily